MRYKNTYLNSNLKYDFIAHIRPTSPLRKISQMKKAIKFFMKSNFTSLRSVHEMKETAYKTFEIRKGKLKPLINSIFNDKAKFGVATFGTGVRGEQTNVKFKASGIGRFSDPTSVFVDYTDL